jgi:hypothetical protein
MLSCTRFRTVREARSHHGAGVGQRQSRNPVFRQWLRHSTDVRHQAFNPFFTTRRESGSTRLGLHIVHNIVTNRLGGQLNVDSAPGGGTKIQIILPPKSRAVSVKRRTATLDQSRQNRRATPADMCWASTIICRRSAVQRRFLARNGHCGVAAACPLSEVKPKTCARREYFAF